MKIKFLLFAVSFVAMSNFIMAQSSGSYGLPKQKDFDKLSVGISGGMNWFQGDLNSNSQNNNAILKNIKNPVIGLKLGYQLSHSVQVNLRGYYTKFTGTKDKEDVRLPDAVNGNPHTYFHPSFESPDIQGSFNINYTLGNISFLQRNKRLHFFGELGVGVFTFKPKVKGAWNADGNKDSLLLDTKNMVAEGMIPISLGMKYEVKRFDIGLMLTYHKTLTDNVDQVHKPLSETDNYSFITINFNYTLGKKQAMMEWVNPMEVVYSDMADLKDKMDVLSGDKDKDGVSDLFDKDNSTPEGTKVYGDGTAVDTDGDGIPDNKDADPFSAKGAKVDANGVEVDSDGDGVPDSRDLEPNTPKGSIVNFQGIAIGAKPGESASATASAMAASWLPSVYFDVAKSAVKSVYRDRLNTIARIMKNNPNIKVHITGNTDVDAGEDYNQKLGQKRADACKDHLIKVYGIDAARLTTESKGKVEQMAKGIKLMNRRVDFTVEK